MMIIMDQTLTFHINKNPKLSVVLNPSNPMIITTNNQHKVLMIKSLQKPIPTLIKNMITKIMIILTRKWRMWLSRMHMLCNSSSRNKEMIKRKEKQIGISIWQRTRMREIMIINLIDILIVIIMLRGWITMIIASWRSMWSFRLILTVLWQR